MRCLIFSVCLVLLASTRVSESRADLLINGSFEQGTATTTFTTLPLGSTAITGWVVTNTDIDIVGTFWVSQHGARSIDLEGLQPGCLAQTLTTVPGTVYHLSFYLAGNPACGSVLKQGRVSAAGQSLNFTFNTTGHTRTSMGWIPMTWSFTANSSSTTLEFCGTAASGSCGPAIDNVVLDAESPAIGSTWGRLKTLYR